MPNPTLEPGSPSAKMAAYLRAHPDDQMTRQRVGMLLNIHPGMVDNALQDALTQALVTAYNDGDAGRMYRAGPMLAGWQPGAPARKTAADPAARKPATKPDTRGGLRTHLPALDGQSFVVRSNVPAPITKGRGILGQTRYDSVFDRLHTPGTCIDTIPAGYAATLQKASLTYLKHRHQLAERIKFVVRRVDDQYCGVWSLPKDPGAPKDAGAGK